MTEPVHREVRGSTPVVHLPEPRRLVRWLAVIIAVLVVMSLAMDVIRFIVFEGRGIARGGTAMGVWDLDTEGMLPTWFSVLLLASIGGLLVTWRRQLATGVRADWAWMVLGVAFLGISFDEMAALHERLIEPVRSLLDIESGPLFFAWVVPAAVGVVVFFVALIPFLRTLPRVTAVRFVVAGGVFVAGAMGVELIGGTVASSLGQQGMAYQLVTSTEEALEMVGALLFLRGILLHRELMLTEAEARDPQPASL